MSGPDDYSQRDAQRLLLLNSRPSPCPDADWPEFVALWIKHRKHFSAGWDWVKGKPRARELYEEIWQEAQLELFNVKDRRLPKQAKWFDNRFAWVAGRLLSPREQFGLTDVPEKLAQVLQVSIGTDMRKSNDEGYEVEAKLERLLELRIADELSAEEYRTEKEKSEGERDSLRRALERLQSRRANNATATKDALLFVERAAGVFERAPEKLKRQIATSLAERYILTQGKLHIHVHPLLRQLSTLEPPENGSQQIQRRDFMLLNPRQCAEEDLNLHGVSPTSTSRMRVYQFHHPRESCL